jgi:hypothetical protein
MYHTALERKNLNNIILKGALTLVGSALVVAECQLHHIVCQDAQEKEIGWLVSPFHRPQRPLGRVQL